MDVKFEGAAYNAEGIAKYKDGKTFFKKRKHQFFVGDPEQEAKMNRVYKLCKEALEGVAEEPAETEEPAPIDPQEDGAQ